MVIIWLSNQTSNSGVNSQKYALSQQTLLYDVIWPAPVVFDNCYLLALVSHTSWKLIKCHFNFIIATHLVTLLTAGYNYHGTERMYSGVDGRELEADIFVGVVYYQRLRHMVSDKFQVRAAQTFLENMSCKILFSRQNVTQFSSLIIHFDWTKGVFSARKCIIYICK